MNSRIRYTLNDIVKNQFYQMPKFLFEGEFTKLSNNARVLYSQLRNRHSLSFKNKWINENNEVYLIYTRENMAKMLGCSQPTIRKAVKQLTDFGLIEEERLGINKANRIYLTAVNIEHDGLKESFTPDCNNLSFINEIKLHSGTKGNFTFDGKEFTGNKTDINNTDVVNQSINHKPEIDRFDYDTIREVVSKNIDYDSLRNKYLYESTLEDILEIIVDVMETEKDFIRVNGEEKPSGTVKSEFWKLKSNHIEYVMDCLKTNTTKAKNIRAYMITALYNAPKTMNVYYANLVNHDFANYS